MVGSFIAAIGFATSYNDTLHIRNAEKRKSENAKIILKKYYLNGNGMLDGEELKNLARDAYIAQSTTHSWPSFDVVK